jgi:NAD(P)-dependent dehydrogenase (short-subunit alcohol dehydrogenase family)
MRDTGDRNASHATELRNLAERDGLALEVVEIDTGDDGSVRRGVAEVARKAGRIDVLVNNVGQGSWGLWKRSPPSSRRISLRQTSFRPSA